MHYASHKYRVTAINGYVRYCSSWLEAWLLKRRLGKGATMRRTTYRNSRR